MVVVDTLGGPRWFQLAFAVRVRATTALRPKLMRLPPRRSRPLQQVSCTSLRRTVRPTSGRRWLAWTRAGSSGRAATHDGRLKPTPGAQSRRIARWLSDVAAMTRLG